MDAAPSSTSGFNFYYGTPRGTPWKWLDPAALFSRTLAAENDNEEKGSDVNLALHVLNDAWLDAYDCAVVVSNDSDLAEALRLVNCALLALVNCPPASSGEPPTSASCSRRQQLRRTTWALVV